MSFLEAVSPGLKEVVNKNEIRKAHTVGSKRPVQNEEEKEKEPKLKRF